MNEFKHFVLIVASMVVLLLFPVIWVMPVEASHPENVASSPDEEEIKNTIQTYFEARYRIFTTLQPNGFDNLISDQPDARNFLDNELGKLTVEIKHTELNHLRYVKYKFFLDFKDISIDNTTKMADVYVTVGHEVIREISAELDPEDPIVSRMHNLEHRIILRQEHDQWKIVSDYYTDYLWRMLRQTKVPTDEILQTMKESSLQTLQSSILQAEFNCDLPVDESSHPYERETAVSYAMTHVFNYNPNYPNYDSDPRFGDCTNFISQALYEGGNVSMAFCDTNGPYCTIGSDGNLGWFFQSDDFRASAWTHVGKFHEFVLDPIATEQYGWTEGPEGCEVSIDQVTLGDVIQYEWGNGDDEWDHAVIIVGFEDGVPLIASHSEDVGPELYTYFSYQDIRFIHIERSDGYDTTPPTTPTFTPTATPTLTPTATFVPGPRGYYPNGIHVTYYNDVPPAEYFLDQPINWNTFTPPEVYEEDVLQIDFDWGTTSPAPGVNNLFWSARYEGTLLVPQDGTYTFYLDNLDDGGRLYIDGTAIIDQWLVQGPHFYSAQIPLVAGYHTITVEYAQGPGNEGSISVAWELPGVFLKEIIGPASAITITPSPTPTPSGGCILTSGTSQSMQTMKSVAGTPTPYGTSTPVFPASELLAGITESLIDPVERANLIYRVRDEIMSTTSEGQWLIDLYYQHSLEIATLMLADTDLYDQGFEALDAFLPGLQALVDGNGETVTITAEQVNNVQAFLNELSASGSPELQQAIQDERDRYPLENLIGVTMDQAWVFLNGFPSTSVLDDFNRADGPIGANWSGNKTRYEISSNQLRVKYSGSNTDIYWSASPFGADQEAYITFSDLKPSADEQDLLLKAQSPNTWGNGVLEVWYDAPGHRAQVWTYKWPQGWVKHGADIPVTFVDGDTFGARALADGTVEVYRNAELLATRDITSWPHYDDGGYIGLWFIDAYNARLDDFGGGTIPGGMASMSMAGGAPESLIPEQWDVNLENASTFWQGIPVKSEQEASVTFATLQTDSKSSRLKPQSNGVWGEGVVEVLYDVASQRIQVWMYEPDNGWVQFGKDIPVKFEVGDRFHASVRSNGMLEIYRNGKLFAKQKVDSAH